MGSAACGRCHAEAYAAWSGSHHDLAMQVADAHSVLGDFEDARFEDAGASWRFFRRDGGFFVNAPGADGVPADFQVRFTFGVEPLQQYLVELPDGRLQALTVAWDTRPEGQGGARWFSLQPDAPPGDVLHWTGVGNRWNTTCAHCHSTRLEKRYDLATRSYATRYAELDVACEACHGPGSRHVAWADSGASGDPRGLVRELGRGEVAWVMDPASGIARRAPAGRDTRELEACAGCHSRRSLLSEDYGGSYLDRHLPALLEEGLYFADGQIRDEVYVYGSFVQSRMYHAGVTCSDCHDPHSLALRASGDALCGRCHAPERFATAAHHHHPEASEGARCVACHMPARTYMQVDDRRDHAFKVPRPDLSQGLGTPNACSTCHTERDAAWAAQTLAGWSGRGAARASYARAIHAGVSMAPGASRLLIELADTPEAPAMTRATAVALLAARPTPAAAEAIGRAAASDAPLLRLAAARAAASLPPDERVRRAGRLLSDPSRAVRVEAGRSLAGVPGERLAGLRPARDRAVAEYRETQALHLDEPSAHVNLALLHLAEGDTEAAERGYRDALRVGEWFLPAYVNLADLYRALGRDDEGEPLLREALRREPESAQLHHALGLLLVRSGRAPEALASLERAAELAPGSARFAYVHAVALHSAGRVDPALDALRAATLRHPADRELLQALVAMSRDAGRRQEAAEALRRLRALDAQDGRPVPGAATPR